MTLAERTAILGIIFGTVGLVTGVISLIISLLNYRRDKPKIVVSLQWDAETRRGHQNKIEESWGHIYVTNKGRRPAYITSVWLEYPNESVFMGLLTDGTNSIGHKLLEGDAPLVIKVPQHGGLKKYSKDWQKIRAIAKDSLGSEYKSKKVDDRPSWV